jgi:outer membrane protein assembly factor BamB
MRHDARNTGASPLPGRYGGDRPWSFATSRGIFSTAGVGADGTVYFGSADNTLYALGPDGAKRWSYPTGGIIDTAPALLAGGADGPSVVIGSGDENLYRLRAGADVPADERVLWRFRPTLPTTTTQLVNWWEGSPNVGPDGAIFVGNTGGGAYAVNPDGTQRWAVQTGNSVWTSPAIGPDGTTYWGSLDLAVRAVSAAGVELWRRTTLGFVTSSPALSADGTLYIGSFDGRLYALDSASGGVLWTHPTGDHIYASPALLEDAAGKVTTIVIASTDGNLTAMLPRGDVQ